MRKYLLHVTLILVVLAGAMGTSAPGQGSSRFPQATPTADVRIISSDRTGITLELTPPDASLEQAMLAGLEYTTLTIPGCTLSPDPGRPALPRRDVLLGVPPGATLRVTAEVLKAETLPGRYRVAPVPRWEVREEDGLQRLEPVYDVDATIGAGDVLYPADLARIASTGYLRSQRLASLELSPIQYHPATGELRLIQQLRVRLDLAYPNAAAELEGTKHTEEPSFEAILGQSLLNYETAQNWRTSPSLSLSPSQSLSPVSHWTPPDPAWKMPVPAGETGLYRLTYTDLQTAGLPVDTLDPRTFQIYNQGAEVAIHVTGQDDAHLDSGDTIEFYGVALDTRYTDTNVYWLTYGAATGLRMGTRNGAPAGAPIPAAFTDTVQFERSVWYWPSVPTGDDHWFWGRMYANSAVYSPTRPLTATFTGAIGLVSTDTLTCTVGLYLYGTTYTSGVSPDHHAIIYLNDQWIHDAQWDGQIAYSALVNVPQAYLQSITNTFRIDMPADTGAQYDGIYVNKFSIDYGHRYEALDDELAFTQESAGAWQYQITNFAEPDIPVFDVTDPAHVVRIAYQPPTHTPVLEINKADSQDPVAAGGVLTYTLTVNNIGDAAATGVVVTDVVPAHTTFRYAANGGVLDGDEVRWSNLTLSDGDSLQLGFSVTVESSLPNNFTLTNADYGVQCAQGISATGAAVTTRVTNLPILSIHGVGNSDQVAAGDVLTYTLTVHNSGNAPATGVTVTNAIPTHTTFRHAADGGSMADSKVTWTGRTVATDDDLVLQFSVDVDDSLPEGTVITNGDYGVQCAQGVSAAGDPVTTTVTTDLDHHLFLPMIVKDYAGAAQVSQGAASATVLRFQDTVAGPTSYLALAASRARTPLSITADTPSDLDNTANQADYVIIAYDEFVTSTQPLADYWHTQGLNTMLVPVSDVYDEFSYGVFDPTAIRDFLAYAYANWQAPQPAYVLLVGDATYDYRDYTGFGRLPGVPSYMVPTPLLGETGSDNWYACVSGTDYLPDLHIGRLPANSTSQVDVMVNKTLDYAQSPPAGAWNQDVLFVADNADSGGPFDQYSDLLVNGYIPPAVNPIKVYFKITHSTQKAATLAITTTVNNGALLVNYIGHGGWNVWAGEKLLYCVEGSRCDFGQMNNGGKQPFVVSMTCLDGYFVDPNPIKAAMAERWLLREGGGGIATYSATGLGLASGHDYLNRGLFTAIFTDTMALGPAVTASKLYLYSQTGVSYQDLIDTYHLMGDPALSLYLP